MPSEMNVSKCWRGLYSKQERKNSIKIIINKLQAKSLQKRQALSASRANCRMSLVKSQNHGKHCPCIPDINIHHVIRAAFQTTQLQSSILPSAGWTESYLSKTSYHEYVYSPALFIHSYQSHATNIERKTPQNNMPTVWLETSQKGRLNILYISPFQIHIKILQHSSDFSFSQTWTTHTSMEIALQVRYRAKSVAT